MSTKKSPLFLAYVCFALVSFIWGTTYLGIRIGVETMPPFWMAAIRQSSAGLILVIYCMIRGQKFPPLNQFVRLAVPGLLMITTGNGLVTWAEQYINSGLAAILCSMNPVWVMVIGWAALRKEKLDKNLVIGIFMGFLGILVIFMNNLGDFTDPKYALGILGIVLANIGWASGTLYISYVKPNISPVFAAGWQMLIAGLALFLLSFIFEKPFETKYTTEGIWALVYLSLIGSLVAYGAFVFMLTHLSPTKSSAYSYINTVVAVILGWWWFREPLTINIIIGTLITIAGIYIVNANKGKAVKGVVPVSEQ